MADEIKHTPGPWVRELTHPNGKSFEIRTPYGLYGGAARIIAEKVLGEANATLIAAAPDMFAALRDIMQAREAFQLGARDGITMGLLSSGLDAAASAIAKATGGAA